MIENNDTKNLIKLYNKLGLNNKRNEFSSLLIKISEILNEISKANGLEYNNHSKNYDSVNQKHLTEDDMLSFYYEDLWKIKNQLLLILGLSVNNDEQ